MDVAQPAQPGKQKNGPVVIRAPFQGHSDTIGSVAFSPDGQSIVSSSDDKTIRLWDLQGNPIGNPFQGHSRSVFSVTFSPDGKTIVSGSADHTIRLWDLQGNPIGEPFQGHSAPVWSVAFGPNGKTIASGSNDNTIRLWDLNGNPIGEPFQGHLDTVLSVAFSPDGNTLASSSADRTIRLWNLHGNLINTPFKGHLDDVWTVAFINEKIIVSGSDDKTIRLWDLHGNLIEKPFEGHSDYVRSVAFSPDGNTLASGSLDKTIQLWDLQGNRIGKTLQGHSNTAWSAAFSPDGKTIVSASADHTIRLWDLQGNPIREPFQGHSDAVMSVAFSPDGNTIVSAGQDNTIRLWDLNGNLTSEPFHGHSDAVMSVAFSPDGNTIVSGGYDNTIRLWDLNGNPIGEPFQGHSRAVLSVAFGPVRIATSKGLSYPIISGSQDNTIRLWDLNGNLIGEPFQGHSNTVLSVAFSPDGNTIVSGSYDNTIRLWDLNGNPIGESFQGHSRAVLSVAFSPDGNTIISGSSDNTIRIWDLNGNSICEPFQGHSNPVWSVVFNPDGNTIASSSSDRTIRLWPINPKRISIPQSFNNDLAEGEDALFIQDELDALTQVLMLRLLKPPLAVALLGSWGSGKSFAMHLIQSQINAIRTKALTPPQVWGPYSGRHSPYVGHIYQIKFDAWSYAKENLWASLMQKIFFELNRQISWEQQLGEFLIQNQYSDKKNNHSNKTRTQNRNRQKWFSLRIAWPTMKRLRNFRKHYRFWLKKQTSQKDLKQPDRRFDTWIYQPVKRIVYPWLYFSSTLLKNLDLNIYQPMTHSIIGIISILVGIISLAVSTIHQLIESGFETRFPLVINSTYSAIDNVCNILGNRKLGEYNQFRQYYAPPELWDNEKFWIENIIELSLFFFFVGFPKRRRNRAQQWDPKSEKSDKFSSEFITLLTAEKLPQEQEQYAQILREGGNIWQSIYILDESKRTKFLTQELEKSDHNKKLDQTQLKNLKEPNYLWNTLSDIRQQERRQLTKAEASLQAKERELQRSLSKIEFEVDQKLSREKFAAIWKPLLNTVLRQRYSEEQIEEFTTKGQTIAKIPAAFQSLTGFVTLFFLAFGFVYFRQPDKFPFLPSPTDILQFAKYLWQTIQTWLNATGLPTALQSWIAALLSILPIVWNYIQAVQKEQARIQSERESLLAEKQSDTTAIAEDIAKLKLQINEQRQRIGIIADAPSLLDFVNSRLDDNAYGQHLGLMKQIQQDLYDLTQQLTPGPHNAEALKKLFPRGPARVVVYIDDLDRCPPDRVVQVLEAVQLLLKTKLFIVVLAIDDRYIARALEEVYQGVLKRGGVPSGVDYLEKIIQIPYRMRPISQKNVKSYLAEQVQVKDPEQTEIAPDNETQPKQSQTPKASPTPKQRKPKESAPKAKPKRSPRQKQEQTLDQEERQITASESELQQTPQPFLEQRLEADFEQVADSDQEQQTGSAPEPLLDQKIGSQSPEQKFQEPPPEPQQEPQQPTPSELSGQSMGNIIAVTEFDQAEFDLLVECCNHVDITPRTGKRLTNIYKVLKVIWSKRGEPTEESKKVVLVFLALSGRYPSLMRDVFQELDARFDEHVSTLDPNPSLTLKWNEFYTSLNPPAKSNFYAHMEWRRFEGDITRILGERFEIDRDTFHLALSFCFVGDIGYDPTDTPATTEKHPGTRDLPTPKMTE
ncbi:MAG: P-loop NTPase fold protein [Cyanobacteria bacterium P01_D01_bin.156]